MKCFLQPDLKLDRLVIVCKFDNNNNNDNNNNFDENNNKFNKNWRTRFRTACKQVYDNLTVFLWTQMHLYVDFSLITCHRWDHMWLIIITAVMGHGWQLTMTQHKQIEADVGNNHFELGKQ